MADEMSSDYGDRIYSEVSAFKDLPSSVHPTDFTSNFSSDEKKPSLIVSNQDQESEVMINGVIFSSPEGNSEESVEKIQNLDVELEKKVDSAHDFETIGAAEDGNREAAADEVEEKDFAGSVLSFDGIQDCAKKEFAQEIQLSAGIEVDGKEGFMQNEGLSRKEGNSESILEIKKKLLLEELEAMLVHGEEIHIEKGNNNPLSAGGTVDNCTKTMLTDEEKIADQQNDSGNLNLLSRSHLSLKNSLKIEVIDETALVESVHVSKIGNVEEVGIVYPTRSMNKPHEPDRGAKKAKRSRRKAREVKIPEARWNMGNVNELHRVILRKKNADGIKIVYSRKDIEALRFVNVAEQKRLWKAICKELVPVVAKEYSSLTSSNYPRNIGSTSDSMQHSKKREEASSIIREGGSESLDGEIEDMEGDNDVKKIVFSEPSCSLGVHGDSDDDDDDKYYYSIQRPAFLVEGEPDFESGPPEDGLEYLRRTRWEASHIPNVTVAKVDRSNFKKEQSVYMPVIPAIAKCPHHLLPSKEWEDAFLADFSILRQALSCSEGSLQSDFILHEKFDFVVPDSFDQPSVLLPAIDVDAQQTEEQIASSSAKENSCNNYPSFSEISKMNSVFRVSSLRKRVNSFETQTTLSRTDCLWLFALSAAVDTPLDADTCATFRSLLRKCASLRAEKTELDDEVIMLNILATVSGRYFGQSEN